MSLTVLLTTPRLSTMANSKPTLTQHLQNPLQDHLNMIHYLRRNIRSAGTTGLHFKLGFHERKAPSPSSSTESTHTRDYLNSNASRYRWEQALHKTPPGLESEAWPQANRVQVYSLSQVIPRDCDNTGQLLLCARRSARERQSALYANPEGYKRTYCGSTSAGSFSRPYNSTRVAKRTEFIELQDIRRIQKGIEAETVRLHPDDGQSTLQWIERLRRAGHLLGFKSKTDPIPPGSDLTPDIFMLMIQTDWQRHQNQPTHTHQQHNQYEVLTSKIELLEGRWDRDQLKNVRIELS
ncbi:hypothetical protein B0H17DRAFT_1133839 [Mycena rosella]|uniref:Uncharacterized protein n=1 Tax=Mycena rosella TaxID=1033263 RepID=A0AAD7GEK7_MYCRO|nr:hypothetical protein B0H17DRAFT_1133839 [Mycena rosella]